MKSSILNFVILILLLFWGQYLCGCAFCNTPVDYFELTQAAVQSSYHQKSEDEQEKMDRLHDRWWSYMIALNPRLTGLYKFGYRSAEVDNLIIKWPMNLWATCRLDDRIAVLIHDGGEATCSRECFILETDLEGRLQRIWRTHTGGMVHLESATMVYQKIQEEGSFSYLLTGNVILGSTLPTLWQFAIDDKQAITTGIYEITGKRKRYFMSHEGIRRPSFIGATADHEKEIDWVMESLISEQLYNAVNEYRPGLSKQITGDPYEDVEDEKQPEIPDNP